MAVKPTAPRVMNGKWGMVYFDGEPVYETDSYEAKLKIEREDVDFVMQMAKDSKMTGLTGEWSMKVKKVFSRGAQILSEKTYGSSIGIVNFGGQLGGFVGPLLIGWIVQAAGSYSAAFFGLVISALVAVIACLFIRKA